MQIGVIGLNHKSADIELREKLARACERRLGPGNRPINACTFVSLSTCNRIEIYFSSDDLAGTHSRLMEIFKKEVTNSIGCHLYTYYGTDCFIHLVRVTSGMDSAVVGETEIQRQVKKAYEAAALHEELFPVLHFAFQKALKIGKDVRTATKHLCVNPTLEKMVYDLGRQHLENFKTSRILFVGASSVNTKILQFFQNKAVGVLYLCNRTQTKAEKIHTQTGVQIRPWGEISRWQQYDILIFATKFTGYLFHKEHFPKHPTERKLFIDLSVPRNVDPTLTNYPGLLLYNGDQIGKIIEGLRQVRMDEALAAEEMINKAISRHVKAFQKTVLHGSSILR